MAIDQIKLVELDIINKLKSRLDAAEQKGNDVFSGYNIPDDVTDNNTKLSYALTEIGDDQTARNELRDKNLEAQKNLELTNKNIEEDFVNMTNLGNSRIEKYSDKIKALEEEYKTKTSQDENKKNEITSIDEEIKALDSKKAEIQGIDGKGGKIAEAKSKSVKAKDEAKDLAKRIFDIEAKIKEIDKKIEKLNEANKTTNDPEELKKNAEEIASLQGNKSILIKDRVDLAKQYQEKEDEKGQYEQNIRSLQGELLNLDSEIIAKSADKNTIQNELRLSPIVGNELKQAREEFESKKQNYIDSVDTMEKLLNERGINVKAKRIADEPIVGEDESIVADEPIIVKAEDEPIVKVEPIVKAEDEPIVKPEPKVKQEPNKNKSEKEIKSNSNVAPQDNGQYVPIQNENLPVINEGDKKRANLEYVIGLDNEGAILKSDERLKRIQGELGGNDYETIAKALEELKNSPAKLTKTEKNKIKNIMKADKKSLATTVKDMDVDKLDEILKSAGINMEKSKLTSLYKKSFEGQSMVDRLNNGFKEYGEATYGILDGFTQMSDKHKSAWKEVIQSYSDKKDQMSPEDSKNFEKYIITPIKFGTLQQQSKQVCKSSFMKFFSNNENKNLNDIRAAIVKSEIPTKEKSNTFTDSLKDQTEQNPPLNEKQPEKEVEREKEV